MRLAENLQELASAENALGREMDEQIFQARRRNNARQVAELQRGQQQHLTEARNYRQQLIRTFEALVTDHPRYQRMDEVLFYLAFAYQDSNDMTNARRVYLTLIQRFPQSRFIPNAYLSFAEFFFEQGAMAEARQFYDRVISINTPENTIRGYAMYKQAWVLYNLQEFDESLQQFFNVIEYARQHPDNPAVAPLIRSARTELVSAYGSVYGVSRPLRTGETLNTFRRYAENEDGAFDMMERLGELYQDNGQWPNSVACTTS
jgi:TolA-binding protein